MQVFCLFVFVFVFVFYHNCFVVQLEVRDGDSPRSSFIVENSFRYPRFFVIPNEFENCPFYPYEELSWNFDGDCTASVKWPFLLC